MAKIDYLNSVVGEFYPIVPEPGIGRLSFKEPNFGGVISMGIDYHVKAELGGELYTWEIIKRPSFGNSVLIISTKNYNNAVVWTLCHDYNNHSADITVNCKRKVDNEEQITFPHEFEMIFVEDSPLFFYLKPFRGSYLTASLDGSNSRVFGRIETDSGDQMMWYFSATENNMLGTDLKTPIDIAVLEAVSKKVGFTVDEDYLTKLTMKTS
ncbi:MAG: hypothetical protein EOP00_24805 [Pedobacter sp.]|nr:MAG: hypothetical protein EOP00_24805 [Pedobacter sp.]